MDIRKFSHNLFTHRVAIKGKTGKTAVLPRFYQNLHWKLGRLAPFFEIILACLETTAKKIFFLGMKFIFQDTKLKLSGSV